MKPITVEDIQAYLDTHDDGVLKHGSHKEGTGAYCALECVSQLRGADRWTDTPSAAGMPDIRAINDARWSSDEVRTRTMLPMLASISRWAVWTATQKQAFVSAVAIRFVREVVSMLSSLPDSVRQACREVQTLDDAKAAAEAEAAQAAYAAYAARVAAYAAAYAEAGAADSTLILTCRIWQEEADKIQ